MQIEQEASADGVVERATMVLAENAAGVPEGAVVDTDMVGAQDLGANLQSYWLPAQQSGSGSMEAPMGALDHLNYKKRPA